MHDSRLRRLLQALGPFVMVPLVTSCGTAGEEHGEPRSEAPVTGVVTVREGDCMPGGASTSCRTRGLAVRVDAYPLIVFGENEGKGRAGFRLPDGAVPARTTTSDGDGRFSFVLPEGRYTIVALYEDGWYPNSKSSTGEWSAVEVSTAWLEEVAITINRATD